MSSSGLWPRRAPVGAGADQFFSVGWQNRFEGGKGVDSISYAPRDDDFTQGGSGVTVDLGAGRAQTGANRFETLVSIENATGSGADDALFGSAAANLLAGGGGFDQLSGRGGADTFIWSEAREAPVVAYAIDLVTDFTAAEGDRIDLRGIDANGGMAGDQSFAFAGSTDRWRVTRDKIVLGSGFPTKQAAMEWANAPISTAAPA